MGHLVHAFELFGATLLRGVAGYSNDAIVSGFCTFLRAQPAYLDGWYDSYGDPELGISRRLS